MFVGQTLGAFQLDNQLILHQDVREILSHAKNLVGYRKRDLGIGPQPAQLKLMDQSPPIHHFQKPATQHIGDLKNRPQDALSQSVIKSALTASYSPFTSFPPPAMFLTFNF